MKVFPMLKTNYAFIETLLKTDATVTEDDRKKILAICKNKNRYSHCDLISRAEALDLLQVSGPTFLKYIRAGYFTEVRMSPRKIRFFRPQLLEFLCTGAACAAETDRRVIA